MIHGVHHSAWMQMMSCYLSLEFSKFALYKFSGKKSAREIDAATGEPNTQTLGSQAISSLVWGHDGISAWIKKPLGTFSFSTVDLSGSCLPDRKRRMALPSTPSCRPSLSLTTATVSELFTVSLTSFKVDKRNFNVTSSAPAGGTVPPRSGVVTVMLEAPEAAAAFVVSSSLTKLAGAERQCCGIS